MSYKPKKSSSEAKKITVSDIYNNEEEKNMCLERASFLWERLDAKLPKFAKCMLPSNVLYSFWLILPKDFCAMHFPGHDTTVTLVDEYGKEFKTNYLKVRHGLSAGWRGFSIAQKLLPGDIVFFLLVEPCKLQVNIVRRYDLEVVEAAICLMEMNPHVKKTMWSKYSEKVKEPEKGKLKHKEPKEDAGEIENQIPKLIPANKGKRTRRIPRRCISKLSLELVSNPKEH